MDETCRPPSRWGLLALPFVVLLVVPLAILMAVALYLRALAVGIGQLLGWLFSRPPAADFEAMQGPHFSETARRLTPDERGHSVS
jgi:hypothetical protein